MPQCWMGALHMCCSVGLLHLTVAPPYVQMQIQRLLAIGVRSSYPTAVLKAIAEMSLPEIIVDPQHGTARIPVRAKLPGRDEWVQVRGCTACVAIGFVGPTWDKARVPPLHDLSLAYRLRWTPSH